MDVTSYVQSEVGDLQPIETGVSAFLKTLEGVDVAVFDIYGTLMISAAGDISLTSESVSIAGMRKAIELLGDRFKDSDPAVLSSSFQTTLETHLQTRRDEGIEFPEVEIRAVWKEMLSSCERGPVADFLIEEVACRYECVVNPVALMPGVKGMLSSLREAEIPMGIISNAQFYTRPVFESLLGGDLVELGFDPELLVFSFEHGEGKPSTALYELMRDCLSKRGISPESVFYLGNDMKKDVIPSRVVGFRSGLFAGDSRSFRPGDDGVDAAIQRSDAVVTSLIQVPVLLGVGP